MWIPILLNSNPEKTTGELTRDYARVSRYLQNVSGAVGELGNPSISLYLLALFSSLPFLSSFPVFGLFLHRAIISPFSFGNYFSLRVTHP